MAEPAATSRRCIEYQAPCFEKSLRRLRLDVLSMMMHGRVTVQTGKMRDVVAVPDVDHSQSISLQLFDHLDARLQGFLTSSNRVLSFRGTFSFIMLALPMLELSRPRRRLDRHKWVLCPVATSSAMRRCLFCCSCDKCDAKNFCMNSLSLA